MHGIYIFDSDAREIKNVAGAVDWTKHGFEVVGSNSDPPTALDEIAALKPELVIFGTEQPHTRGIEFMKALREAGLDSAFVVLVTWWDIDSIGHLFHSGGFDYLLKPFDKDKAEDLIGRFTRKRMKAT